MKADFSRAMRRGVQRTVLAAALAAGFTASAWALPQFTLDPTGSSGSFTGAAVTADNVIVSNYSTVRLDTTTGAFTESGFLSVQGFQLGGATALATGLNSSYGLYIQFTGSGTQTPGDPNTTPTVGTLDTLEYTLYGFTGEASFGFDGSNNAIVTSGATDTVALATGTLVEGNVFTTTTGTPFTPGATAIVSFTPLPGEEGFFASPVPFFSLASASFVNTASQVTLFDGGFRITQGGGAFNFTATTPIPEPQTYALMLAGLAAVGFVARRRIGS